ncbi:DNA/RNA nuclease SfsA [Schleiferilactobacillus shenzhenensis]|uniref:Sugar fermentation stimulation protein homolog n=1 Tax=Schleiferilactobacillus shenzhenensis LY-73 TaxID=1231336 RepID=U4TT70_9LACO|nr:DNA/RNA nuclease SfsA [Schleiferilactobacillus shenzhenensis]ERL64662.1 SfsA [Schleiferilactobacillus shenzhenensis LY-73]
MEYPGIIRGQFIDRPNRFVAHVLIQGEKIVVHVKNTGRTNILVPGRTVALAPAANAAQRKTAFDLVAVQTPKGWINVDSQAPNTVVGAGLRSNQIVLPGLGPITAVRPETTFHDARFDFYGSSGPQPFFLEVKGVTLWAGDVAAFPDAPTLRGLKHVQELIAAVGAGYHGYLLFLVQIPAIRAVTIAREVQPTLAETIAQAQAAGVHVLAYGTRVTPGTMTLDAPIPFDLTAPFTMAAALAEARA